MTNKEASNTLHDHVALVFEAIKEMAPHMSTKAVPPAVDAMHSLNHIRHVADMLGGKQ